mmetsp:Transcript_17045/g.25805  ORF Transcript_17045/g.25805 Transcript_17045/m.25805 type:complete len:548 (+) Transcript_17045:536-2179(+)
MKSAVFLLTFGCLKSLVPNAVAFVPSSTFFKALLSQKYLLKQLRSRFQQYPLASCQDNVNVVEDEERAEELNYFLEASASTKSRRKVLQEAFTSWSIAALISSCNVDPASAAFLLTPDISVYEVIADASEKELPSIKSVNLSSFDNILSLQQGKMMTSTSETITISNRNNGGVVWLGEHHNSEKDHKLQAQIVQSIYNQQVKLEGMTYEKSKGISHNMSIGLEQVQLQFQPFLDDYIAGTITEEQMLDGVQWSTRWQWDYNNYRPIFQLARKLSIPLIALNVNSEDLAIIEESGIQGLDKSQLRRYITADLKGFGTFITPSSYKAYSAYVIEPSYSLHRQMGLLMKSVTGRYLDNEMSFANFFSGRIMWDESMASHAYQWTKNNPGGIMVGLIGADHVKFEMGVVGRYKRLIERDIQKDQQYQEKLMLEEEQQRETVSVVATSSIISVANAASSIYSSTNKGSINNSQRECISVLLNPTLIDSRPSGSVNAYTDASALSSLNPDKITLQLPYGTDGRVPVGNREEDKSTAKISNGVLPLADYIVVGG